MTPRQPAGRVDGGDRFGGDVGPAHQPGLVDPHDDVGDVAVDHVVAIEHHRTDGRAGGQLLQGLGVWLVPGQQRQLGQRRAKQGSGHQRAAQFLENRCGIGQFTTSTAEVLGDDESGDTHLLAQHDHSDSS